MSNNTRPPVFPVSPQSSSIWLTFNSTSDESSAHDTRYTQLYVVSIVALILVIALILLLHLYLRYVRRRQLPQYSRQRALIALPGFSGVPRYELPGGLDPAEISSMPSFQYCNRQGNVEESNGYVKEDCPICLSFLEEGNLVRMLATCRHVFHVGCIDKWLLASASCPVCRSDVHPGEQSVPVDQVNDAVTGESVESKEVEAGLSVSSG